MTERSDHLELIAAVALLVGVLVAYFVARAFLTRQP